jgi:gamma-butyrobetaine dioxygenase
MYSQVGEFGETKVAAVDGGLRLTSGGECVDLDGLWLRDRATDAASRDPISGQRLFAITDLPADLRVESATLVGDEVEVVFAPGGHRTRYDAAALLDAARTPLHDRRNESRKVLWRRASDLGALQRMPYADYLADKVPALQSVVDVGFTLLTDVPTRGGCVTEVAETFGFVRETNYGRIFDVRIEDNATNLAFTGLAISPHTDNPYRDPVPTLQLLHCLSNAAEGGDSGLVDGFAAAAALREQHPEAFAVLTSTPVGYRFDSQDAHLEATAPLITLDGSDRIREIRFNNRSIQVAAMPPADGRRFYRAYRTFAEMLFDPDAQANFRMTPGDCLIFDNTRLLHARTAFEDVGGRHLQGAYADLDGLLSTLAIAGADR